MSTTTKILRTAAILGVTAGAIAFGVSAAFTSQTDNPGNVVTAGTVSLTDNDGDSALYEMSAAKPGDSEVSCIVVDYDGSLSADVKLFTPSTIGDLGPEVDLTIEAGTQPVHSYDDCTDFTPDAGGPLYSGTLSAFAATHNSWANGIVDNPGTSATEWVSGDDVVYRVTATLSASAPDGAQGDTTGAHTLRWEARNN